ncbi:MAG: phosphotransferase [Candidatus Falkowbacteria bacterium]|nr:phosphotransferase [Candidatus Falkowbacteria bacterium]
MNKILRLFDEAYVVKLFRKEVLPHYPSFSDIKRVVIRPYKELVWETTYHVVISFTAYFAKADGTEDKIPIVCSAHSSEERENVYLALKYLWAAGFPSETIDIPDPLFYSPYFRGTFYRGLKGENLLSYIKNKDFATVEKIVIASARLFARLHALPGDARANFNPINSRIRTVVPGSENIIKEIASRFPDKYDLDLRRIYALFIEKEEAYFQGGGQLSLIHGDAHPENIIQTSANRVGLIDFTDLCLGDLARDLGSFSQQLEYKILRKASDAASARAMKKLFLDTYLAASGLTLTGDLQARIDLYYNWTAVRTATYWLLKFDHDENAAIGLIRQVKANLKL